MSAPDRVPRRFEPELDEPFAHPARPGIAVAGQHRLEVVAALPPDVTGVGVHPHPALAFSLVAGRARRQQLQGRREVDQGPAGLEDLYLSVLNPASRSERQVTAALDIGGKQARVLHTGSDTDAPITRQSIRQGLLQNAAARLGQLLPTAMRGPSIKTSQVAANEQH